MQQVNLSSTLQQNVATYMPEENQNPNILQEGKNNMTEKNDETNDEDNHTNDKDTETNAENDNTNDEDNHTNAEDKYTNHEDNLKKHMFETSNNPNFHQKRRIKMKDNANSINIQPYKDIIMGEIKTIWRLPQVLAVTGLSKGTIYTRMSDGLFPKQVRLGGKAIGWISTEVIKVLDAYAAGLTQEQIRVLVKELHAERSRTAPTDGNDQPVPELEVL